jgi:predicted nucleic acid-binding Zn ribbon protein
MTEDAALNCPNCGASTVRRSRRVNTQEMVRMMMGIYPFRCTTCGDRFWGNVWFFNSWRWARCSRCLSLNLTDWPKRHYHVSTWDHILTILGAKRHRCGQCRNNFLSFRPRMPAYQNAEAEPEDLDFGEGRSVKSGEEKNAKQG